MLSVDDIIENFNYSSEFNSEIDSVLIEGDYDWNNFQPNPNVYERLESSATNWAEKRGFNFESELHRDQLRGIVHAIISVTGDDEIITSDSVTLNLIHFSSAVETNGIIVSEKDTGISDMLGNYTEGWILLPPNAEADFTSVNRRHIRNGVGATFDITKLKATSAVRKQSSKELDFESKFSQLHKAADWTDPDWFTYDYSQMSLVLASAIFDFTDCRVFPYMFQQEGGCGGFPPWKNTDTAISALNFFNNQKSVSSVLAIMDEATQIQSGKLEPRNAVYIHAAHYAQVGDQALSRISNARKYLSSRDPEERMKCLELCKGVNPLPNELLEESVIVDPKDRLLGSAIAEMRKNGLIMTELDVRLKQLGEQKFFDLLGNKNMGLVREDREREKIQIKKNGLTELAKLAASDSKAINLESYATQIMRSYYKMRSDMSDITGFSYEGQIRLFKTADVQDYYERNNLGFVDEMILSLESYRGFRLGQKLGQAKTDLEYQIEWMRSGRLIDLFEGEIPPSMGSDDARIGRKILKEIEDLEEGENIVYVIITNDIALVDSLRILLKARTTVRVTRVSVYDYVKDANNAHTSGRVKLKNFFSFKESYFPSIESAIKDSVDWRWKSPLYHVLWDFPNINRTLEGMRKKNKIIFQLEGGFLRRKTSRNLEGWSSMEWSKFKELDDFKRRLRPVNLR
jgi:hypothetical protein